MLSHRPGTPSERGHKICSILVSAIECSSYLTENCFPAFLLFFLVIFLFLSLFYLSFIPSISLLLYLFEVFVHYYVHTTISLDFFLPSVLPSFVDLLPSFISLFPTLSSFLPVCFTSFCHSFSFISGYTNREVFALFDTENRGVLDVGMLQQGAREAGYVIFFKPL